MKKILSAVLACTATMALASTAFATDAGATDAAGSDTYTLEEYTVTVTVPADGIHGAALEALLLTDEATEETYTWADVEEITFTSDDAFSLSFAADEELAGVDLFVMGVNDLPGDDEPAIAAAEALRDADDGRYATSWTLTADHIALFADEVDVALASESGEAIEVKSEITVKVAASAEDPSDPSDSENPSTGIALAVAPAGLAVAFVAVAAVMSKKKRG